MRLGRLRFWLRPVFGTEVSRGSFARRSRAVPQCFALAWEHCRRLLPTTVLDCILWLVTRRTWRTRLSGPGITAALWLRWEDPHATPLKLAIRPTRTTTC